MGLIRPIPSLKMSCLRLISHLSILNTSIYLHPSTDFPSTLYPPMTMRYTLFLNLHKYRMGLILWCFTLTLQMVSFPLMLKTVIYCRSFEKYMILLKVGSYSMLLEIWLSSAFSLMGLNSFGFGCFSSIITNSFSSDRKVTR